MKSITTLLMAVIMTVVIGTSITTNGRVDVKPKSSIEGRVYFTCPNCNGTGKLYNPYQGVLICARCMGSGVIYYYY